MSSQLFRAPANLAEGPLITAMDNAAANPFSSDNAKANKALPLAMHGLSFRTISPYQTENRRDFDKGHFMAIKKSDIYWSLWESCDQLRGGMDASLYKDYILTLLFAKYVSDRAGQADALIEVPVGASFSDMKALRG